MLKFGVLEKGPRTVTIAFLPGCDVKNFEINFIFQLKPVGKIGAS